MNGSDENPAPEQEAAHDADAGQPAGLTPFVPPTVEELAPLFPNVVIEEMIAAGGMGAVYRVLQPQLDRYVALKILPPESGADPTYVERFGREAKLMAQLNHPNIVSIYDFGNTNGLLYFIMEFVDGKTLHDSIQAGHITPPAARLHMVQVSAGLKYAHEKGVLHLDIKPGNIMMNKEGVVKILDFGLASLVGDEKERFGTPFYTAPERYENNARVDHRADIFSLGAVFYEMLTGKPPEGACQPASFVSGSPPAYDQIINKCLQTAPSDRYPDAGALLVSLKRAKNAKSPAQLKSGLAGSAGPSAAGSRASAAADYQQALADSNKKKLIIGGSVVGLAIIAVVALIIGGGGPEPDPEPKPNAGGTTLPTGPGGGTTDPETPVAPEVVIDRSPKSESRLRSGSVIRSDEAPRVAGRKVEVYALIETGGGDGVIVKHGDSEIGYSLHVRGNYLHFTIRAGKEKRVDLKAQSAVSDKIVQVGAVLEADGKITLRANGELLAAGSLNGALPDQPSEGVFVGSTGDNPVGDYSVGSNYQGFIQEVVIRTEPPASDNPDDNPFASGGPFG